MVEETLHLAVYTPDDFETCPNKPVMVYIHGGGWIFGSPSEYDGSALSAYGDVVVVVISYRVSALGFLFGNFGLFDQVAALKWVKGKCLFCELFCLLTVY